jgi:hypothetical protein
MCRLQLKNVDEVFKLINEIPAYVQEWEKDQRGVAYRTSYNLGLVITYKEGSKEDQQPYLYVLATGRSLIKETIIGLGHECIKRENSIGSGNAVCTPAEIFIPPWEPADFPF